MMKNKDEALTEINLEAINTCIFFKHGTCNIAGFMRCLNDGFLSFRHSYINVPLA